MNFHRLILFLLTLSAAPSFFSQQLSGSIADSAGQVLPFCAVGLLKGADSAIVKGTVSDDAGRFEFAGISPGNYLVTASAPGYRKFFSHPVTVKEGEKVILQQLRLMGGSVNLKEVEVGAIRNPIEFKGGNIIANIEGSPLATGNNVYELLNRLPGVMIDNDNISVQGQGGVRVYIDDRLQQMSGSQLLNFLRGLNSEQIAKMEIILNPPAKYDAAGKGPVINIVTRKTKITGFSGNGSYTFSKGHLVTNNAAFSLNYKGKKLNVFSNLSGYLGTTKNEVSFDRRFRNGDETLLFSERSTELNRGEYGTASLGLDWFINKKNTVGMKIEGYPGVVRINFDDNINSSDPAVGYSDLRTGRSYFNWWYYSNGNVNYEHAFDTSGTKLKMQADFYYPYDDIYTNDFNTRYLAASGAELSPPLDFRNENIITLRILSLKADFEKQLDKSTSITAGVKRANQRIHSDYRLEFLMNDGKYKADSLFTNIFEYYENITGAYFTVDRQTGKFSYNLGLRAEHTDVKTNSISSAIRYKRQYLQVFPVFSINYTKSQDHIFSLSGNTRVNRPDYNSFNPYRNFHNILQASEGNPFLVPEYNYNLNFNYVFKGKITNTLMFSYSRNPFLGYPVQNDSSKTIVHTIRNVEELHHIRYVFYARKDLKKWYTVGLNIGIYYIDMSGPVEGAAFFNSALPWWVWTNHQIILPKNFRIEVMAFYWSPWLGGVGKMEQRWGVDVGLKKSFLDKKLNFTLAVNDIFFTKNWTNSVNFRNQDSYRVERQDTRRLYLGVSYNFGRIKVEQRQVQGPDEGGRIGR